MKFKNIGSAAIPLILGLGFMVAATAIAVSLSQRSQNLQNRAAFENACLGVGATGCFTNPCCSGLQCNQNICQAGSSSPPTSQVPCQNYIQVYNQYCTSGVGATSPAGTVSCAEAQKIILSYCSGIVTIAPSKYPTAAISKTPTPTYIRFPTKPPIYEPTVTSPIARPTNSNGYCVDGTQRFMGRIIFTCVRGRWQFQGFGLSSAQATPVPR